MTLAHLTIDTPLGPYTLAAHASGLASARPADAPPGATAAAGAGGAGARAHLTRAAIAFEAYFAGAPDAFEALALVPEGTAFQRRVWQALRELPYGATRSYGELARSLGTPRAARAVGGACHRNPIAVALPCHRVVASDGALTGYSAGLPRKRWLLAHEAREVQAASSKKRGEPSWRAWARSRDSAFASI